jgi:tRNA dimethylallyltransferase
MQQPRVIVVVGPTASGKSELALSLAKQFAGEIINADSMQVYSGMEIGTAGPPADYFQRVPHHLFGIVSPAVNFTVADYCREAKIIIEDINKRNKLAILAGGSGLYIRALLEGLANSPGEDSQLRRELTLLAEQGGNGVLLERLAMVDPESAARLHVNDRVRIIRALEVHQQSGQPISQLQTSHGFASKWCQALKIGLHVQREELYRRIEQRVELMIAKGLLDEVSALLAKGYGKDCKALKAIGYKEAVACLEGVLSLPEAIELIKRDTRRYAKRQLTWFKSDPEIYWVEYPESFATICNHVIDFFALRRGL